MTDNLSYDSFLDLCARFPAAPTIRATKACMEQFRWPKTKKRRIRNKWANRPANWRPSRRGYLDKVFNVLYVHPDILAEIEKLVDKDAQL